MELDVLPMSARWLPLLAVSIAVACASQGAPIAGPAPVTPAVSESAGDAGTDAGSAPARPDAGSADANGVISDGNDASAEPLPLPEGTTVLHIGDSMAGALGVALNAELKQRNVRGVLRYKQATFIPTWAWSKELPLYLAQFNPDLVVITLGTNEVKMIDPTIRAPTIRHLVERLGGRPCVWITPPLWAGQTAMYRVIRDNIAPCRYMDTEQVYPNMPRVKDKIHPSIGARKIWAERVVQWLAKERRPTPERPWQLAPEPAEEGN